MRIRLYTKINNKLRNEKERQGDGEWERGRLTLNETLVPTMHEINYAHGLPGTSTNKLPFMLKLGKDDFLSLSFKGV